MTLAALTGNDISIMFVAGLTLIAWAVARKRMVRPKGNSASDFTSSRMMQGAGQTAEFSVMTKQMNETLVELQETARRIAAQIDNRYQKLETLIADAEQKIARLEQLKAELEKMGASRQQLAAAETSINSAPLPSLTSAYEDPQHRAVYTLADRGKTTREIAQEIGKQPGEVELILALRGGR